MQENQFIQSGRRAIEIQLTAVQALVSRLNDTFTEACQLIVGCEGRVIMTGMGKSGHIARKLAASFASTGTPSFFVHPGEAMHGDLGMITSSDIVIALSNSGNNTEILQIIPTLKRRGVDIIAMTGNQKSPLAEHAKVVLDTSVAQEACPLNLAPTASTTVTLVLGDALIVSVLEAKGFTTQDFALSHPGGKLGRTLLTIVDDIMHTGDKLPLVPENATVDDALGEMTDKSIGMTGIVDQHGKLVGIYTDGDLRRSLQKHININEELIKNHMTVHPQTVPAGMLAASAVTLMKDRNINGLYVVDQDHRPVGAFNMLMVLHAGLS